MLRSWKKSFALAYCATVFLVKSGGYRVHDQTVLTGKFGGHTFIGGGVALPLARDVFPVGFGRCAVGLLGTGADYLGFSYSYSVIFVTCY